MTVTGGGFEKFEVDCSEKILNDLAFGLRLGKKEQPWKDEGKALFRSLLVLLGERSSCSLAFGRQEY
jgi:hypothetical protein